MRRLSKSKILAHRQCPKRLWLALYKPEMEETDSSTQGRMDAGNQVGELARRVLAQNVRGELYRYGDYGITLIHMKDSLMNKRPIFEGPFMADDTVIHADILLPHNQDGKQGWHLVEVKSSTSVKDYHRDDLAIQAYVIVRSGMRRLRSVSLAVIDSSWIYPGNNDYQGLFKLHDLTLETFERKMEVDSWIKAAHNTAASFVEPDIAPGPQCSQPYDCGFHAYCTRNQPVAEHPITWLPHFSSAKIDSLLSQGVTDMRDVPDAMLNDKQRRVRENTLAGTVYFNTQGAASALASHGLPAYFMDFETTQHTIPVWTGTRPYQQIPFQFSVHTLEATGQLDHREFLDLSGNDPSESFARALIAACGNEGPVYVYSASFENGRIADLAERFAHLRDALLAISSRVVDLLPVAREHYYNPSQQGSWSIKKVLPALAPELRYDALDGVQDGGMAMDAYAEAIQPDTVPERKTQLESQLLAYCKLDTYAMVRLWQVFSGRTDLEL